MSYQRCDVPEHDDAEALRVRLAKMEEGVRYIARVADHLDPSVESIYSMACELLGWDDPLAPPSAEGGTVDDAALTRAHKAVEDVLVTMRDSRLSLLNAANGLVINERDGTPSEHVRLGTRDALRIGIAAYLDASRECPVCGHRTETPGLCAPCERVILDAPQCDGRCVTPEDLGVMGTGVEVAHPDPECSLHGSHESAPRPDLRDPACVERWPECEEGAYDPRCCRWPKSCSADVTHLLDTPDDQGQSDG